MRLILGLLALLVVCAVGLGIIGAKQRALTAPRDAARQARVEAEVGAAITDAKAKQLVTRFEPAQSRAYVPPTTWARLDAAGKEELTLTLAVYCKQLGHACAPFVVYDALSARELAGIRGGRFVVK